MYDGISAILKSVAPNGSRVMGVSLLLVDTGEVGGASAALWDSPHESSILPCIENTRYKIEHNYYSVLTVANIFEGAPLMEKGGSPF